MQGQEVLGDIGFAEPYPLAVAQRKQIGGVRPSVHRRLLGLVGFLAHSLGTCQSECPSLAVEKGIVRLHGCALCYRTTLTE